MTRPGLTEYFQFVELLPTQQIFQLLVLPSTEKLDRIGTVSLAGVEDVRPAIRRVTAITVIQGVAVVVKGQHPAIDLYGHEAAIDLRPCPLA